MSEIYSQLGKVYALLLENREITRTPMHRRASPEEREAATLLQDLDFFQAMEEFVEPQGFTLKSFTDFDMPGIGIDEQIFLLIRQPDADRPYFGEDAMLERAAVHYRDSKELRGIWFLHLWAMANHLLYTAVQRSVREVARYTDVAFTAQDLVEIATEHIEETRQEGLPEDPAAQKAWSILVDPKHRLDRRVKAFLQAMVDGKFLYQPRGEEIYRQTLLGALEMSELFERCMAPLVPEDQGSNLFREIVDLAISSEMMEGDD